MNSPRENHNGTKMGGGWRVAGGGLRATRNALLATVLALGWGGGVDVHAQRILAWDFTGESNNVSSIADIIDSSLDSTNVLTRGPGASASSGANSFRTTGFQNNGISTTNTDYFQFSLSAVNGKTLSLSSLSARFNGTATFVTNNSNAGVTNQFAFSTNGTNWTLIGSPTVLNGSNNANWTMTVTLSNVATLQNLPSETTATFRFYASGQTTTGGWGFFSSTNGIYGLDINGSIDGPATIPTAPVSANPTLATTTGFTANWAASSGATKYFLDVATDSGFASLVSGFNNLDVLNVTSFAVTGLNPATTYYYRVRANNSAGTSENSQAQVALTASLQAPGIAVSTNSLTGFSYNGAGPSTAQSVSVTASNLTGAPGSLSVAGSTNYEVSVTSSSNGFGTSALITYTNATLDATNVWIRLKANLAAGNYNAETISISGGGAANPATVSASGTVTKPTINLSTTNLGSFTGTNGIAGAPKTNTIAGINLLGDITIVATNFFEVSGDAGTTYTNNLVLTPTAGVISNAVLFRIASNAPVGSLGTNLVTLSTPETTNRTVQVIGTVVNGGLTLSILGTNTATVAENGSALTLNLTLTPAAPAGGVTVTLASTDADNSELDLSATSVAFAEGETTKSVTLTPKADNVFDLDQTITITATATNWTINGGVTVIVQNVDAEPATVISLTSTNSNSYTQNFDGLGTTTISNVFSPSNSVARSLGAITSSSLNGWYGAKGSGTGTNFLNFVATNGNITSGGLYNFGTNTANTNRSLGTLASGSSIMRFGALIRNETGTNLNSVKLSLTAKFWKSPASASNTLTFAFGKVDGVTNTTANFLISTNSSSRVLLNLNSPTPFTGSPTDGNVTTNRVVDVALPMALGTNEVMFIRWQDADDSGNDGAIGIDDFSLTGSTEALTFDGEGAATLANTTPSSPYALSGIWPRGASNQVVSATIRADFDTSTLTAASVAVPVAFGVPTAGAVTLSGGATGGTISVTGQLVTVTGTAITKANPGVINIAGLSTPDTATVGTGDGIYSFAVSTAGVGGNLAPILISPQANVLIPIANIRDFEATNFTPLDLNKIVAVEGVCTWGTLGSAYFQDTDAGVNVNSPTVMPVPLTLGNKYAVIGKVLQSSGLTRITPVASTDLVNLGSGTLPTPFTLTLPQAASQMELHEGKLVRIENLRRATNSTNSWAAGVTIAAVDAGSNPIDIRISNDSSATNSVGFPVTVVGILGQFDTSNPRDTGYQIMPRTQADLTYTGIPALSLTSDVSTLVESTTEAVFTVGRSGAATSGLTINLQLSLAEVLEADTDSDGVYEAFPSQITIPAGEPSIAFLVRSKNDSVGNGTRSLTVTVSAGGFENGALNLSLQDDDTTSDSTPPVITLNGDNPLTVLWGLTWIDDYSAFDAGDNASVTVNRVNPVDTKVPGSYTVSYSATDSVGNTATATRTVNVRFAGGGTNRGPEGLPDAVRFALGADGTNRMNAALMPTSVTSNNTLVLNYHGRPGTTPVELMPVVSTDLANSNSWSTAGITVTNLGPTNVNGVTLDRRQASVPMNDGTRKFLRLRATTSQ